MQGTFHLHLPSNTACSPRPSTKVGADTPGKGTPFSRDVVSHNRGRRPGSHPPRKQLLAKLPPLVGKVPLCTTSQQPELCAIWRNAHSYEHHDFSYCAASKGERKTFGSRIDRRQHHTVEDFCPCSDTTCHGPTRSRSGAARAAISYIH